MSATGRNLAGNERRADDFYETPAWCVRAILPHLNIESVCDPCCGEGALLDSVRDSWRVPTFGIEIDPKRALIASGRHFMRACGDAFLLPWPDLQIITNPPYSLAQEFIERAARHVPHRDRAFLLRLNFLGSQRRAQLHRDMPADIFVLPRRPSFTGKGTDATEYAWYVWGPGRGNRWSILDVESA